MLAAQDTGPIARLQDLFQGARPGGVIVLGRLRPGWKDPEPAPRYQCALSVGDRQALASVVDHLSGGTWYVTPSTFCESILRGRSVRDFLDVSDNPPYFPVKAGNVRELLSITLDLDVGRPGTPSALEAVALFEARILEGNFPLPSIRALSGRGIYLWWRLRGENGYPPLNTPSNLARYRATAEVLMDRLKHLHPDRGASGSPARWFKVPGCHDYKTGNAVVYVQYFDVRRGGRPPVYTFDELEAALNIRPPEPGRVIPLTHWEKPRPTVKRKPHRSVRPHGHEPHRLICEEIRKISDHQGGLRHGCRNDIVWIFFQRCFTWKKIELRHASPVEAWEEMDRQAVLAAVEEARGLNSCFHPPLRPGELAKTFRPGRGKPKPGCAIASLLEVTADEVEALGLRTIVPKEIQQARRAEKERTRARNKAAWERRRKAVDDLLGDGTLSQTEIARTVGCSRQYVHGRKKGFTRQTLGPCKKANVTPPLLKGGDFNILKA